MKTFQSLAFLCALLLLALSAPAQERANIKGSYSVLSNSKHDVLERSDLKAYPPDNYIYFHKNHIRVDDNAGSIYTITSQPNKRETPKMNFVNWSARDEQGIACEVVLIWYKEDGYIICRVEYPVGKNFRSYCYLVEFENQ